VYKGPYGTNLSSIGNPTVKTVKAIPRYVIKPLTYSTALPLHEYSYVCAHLLQRCHDDRPGVCLLITGLRHYVIG